MEEFNKTVVIMDFDGLKHVFETRLANVIFKTKNIGVDFFLCGNYVAALLAETGQTNPESWYAADYFLKAAADDNPAALKQGANVCFLIYAVFPLRNFFCRSPNFSWYFFISLNSSISSFLIFSFLIQPRP